MKKDHIENTVGPWAERKLEALDKYLKFYCTALSRQPFTRIYIDAFAGSCISKIRRPDAEVSPFFDDAEAAEAQDEFVVGSPIRAMSVDHRFHQYYFFDLDESRAETLRSLGEIYDHKEVHVQVGDSNPMIRDLANRLQKRSIRGVAFLDPYGAHLEWSTVEALANTGNFEVIINFPVAMAINRLITKSGDIPTNWGDQLTACFGTEEWRDLAYSVETDLFGNEVITKNGGVSERLLKLYIRRLEGLFPYVAKPHLIRNTRGAPLYYLIWAGPNKLGLKGASHILEQGEKVGYKLR